MRSILPVAAAAALVVSACGDDGDTASADTSSADSGAPSGAGLVQVSPEAAADTIESGPDDLVILDVRTPEEFDDGHLDGATMIDFYRDDFREQLATLDREAPYVLYCRSGNRSGQAFELMRELGFTEVSEIEGGILSWVDAGLPVTAG